MAYLEAARTPCKTGAATLTAPLALLLAEDALKAGRIDNATRYVNIAYAIFDANLGRRTQQSSVLHPNND